MYVSPITPWYTPAPRPSNPVLIKDRPVTAPYWSGMSLTTAAYIPYASGMGQL